MTLPFRSAGRTDTGKVRRRNEDAILVRDDAGLWAVADGLGGHADGDYASRLIVERLAAVPRAGDLLDFVEAIEDALAGVNIELRRAARARGADLIASTVVVLVHDAEVVLCGWAGDSRGYCCEQGRLLPLTRDHLYGTRDANRWSGGSAQPQPGGGVLTRAVGADHALFMDWAIACNGPGTRFVLCSDGVNKEMSDAEIQAACNRHATPEAVLDEVFELSLQRGARDNLAAVIVSLPLDARPGKPSMRERVPAINRDLAVLDEAHRLGNLDREAYHERRRGLLSGLVGEAGSSGQPRNPGPGRFGWTRWWPKHR